jgi:GT2 family glycosyltransferase
VTYQSEDVIAICLEACRNLLSEVVVVDNASTDGTVECARAAGATVIANPENRGFATAVNQGFRATDSELVLVLNPDVRLTSGLQPLEAAALEHGVAGGQLTDDFGRPQQGFSIRRFPTPAVLGLELLGLNRLWPGNPWNREYRYLDRDLTHGGPADQPAGAFLMVRRDVWESLGGFDENFWPIWFEDVDFCRRAAFAGFTIQYVPASQASHTGGHSIKKIDGSSRQLYWYDSLLRYAEKHFRPGEYHLVAMAGAFGTSLRVLYGTLVGVIQERSFGPVTSGLRTLKFVGRRLVSRPPSGPVKI